MDRILSFLGNTRALARFDKMGRRITAADTAHGCYFEHWCGPCIYGTHYCKLSCYSNCVACASC